MENILRKCIDWDKTAKKLKLLRRDNINLRRYVCGQLHYGERDCAADCKDCELLNMDHSISQAELAKVFNVSESMIVNWENNKSKPQTEDLLFYADICGIDFIDVLIFEK